MTYPGGSSDDLDDEENEPASCAHGADGDPMTPVVGCWSCLEGEGIGPLTQEQAARVGHKTKVVFGAEFVTDIRRISGNPRWPVRAVKSDPPDSQATSRH